MSINGSSSRRAGGGGVANEEQRTNRHKANVAKEQMMYFKSQMIEVERQLKDKPNDEDLLSLKNDLEYGMKIAAELLTQNTEALESDNDNGYDVTNDAATKSNLHFHNSNNNNDDDNNKQKINNDKNNSKQITSLPTIYNWQINDFCLAPFNNNKYNNNNNNDDDYDHYHDDYHSINSKNEQLLPAQIIEIDEENNRCKVKFLSSEELGEFEFNRLHTIAHAQREDFEEKNMKKGKLSNRKNSNNRLYSKHEGNDENNDYDLNDSNQQIEIRKSSKELRKQNAKKRLAITESQKNSWLLFKNKYGNKMTKGRIKHTSIFRTPENIISKSGRMSDNSKPSRNRYYF